MSIGSRELTAVCTMMKATPTTTTTPTTMRMTRILASESRTEQWWASTQSHDYLSSSTGDLDENDEDFERLLQTQSFVLFNLQHRCILKMQEHSSALQCIVGGFIERQVRSEVWMSKTKDQRGN